MLECRDWYEFGTFLQGVGVGMIMSGLYFLLILNRKEIKK